MKPLVAAAVAVAALLHPVSTAAQARTLLGTGKIESGGFGGPSVKLTRVSGDAAVLVGGRGGWIINHTIALGGGGWGLATAVDLPPAGGSRRELELGYGGFEVTAIVRSDELVHVTLGALAGGGGVVTRLAGSSEETDEVFVFEPTGSFVLNVSETIRVAVGGGYRMVSGVSLAGVSDDDLSAPFGELMVQFGRF